MKGREMNRTPLAATLVAAALTLSACGGSTDSGTTDSSTDTSTANAAVTDPASASSAADASATVTDTAPPTTATTSDGLQLVSSLPAATQPVEEITWGLAEGEPISLDTKIQSSYVFPNLCDSLLRLNPDYSISPAIAESADWVDPVTFVIKIRPDVKFWDGSIVTADDVVYSLGRHQDPTSQWYAAFVMVTGIEATDPTTVTVHFSVPWSSFRDALVGGAGAVMQAAFGEQVGEALGTPTGGLMCAGPFQLDAWTPGQAIETSAFSDYWDGAPLVSKLTYLFTTDSTALAQALLAGEIDGAFNIAPSSKDQLLDTDSGELHIGPTTGSISFGPTTDQGAAALPAIRRALSMAIDRDQFVEVVLNDLGERTKTFVPPFVWAGSPASDAYDAGYAALPGQELDLDAARELVASSGVDTSEPLVAVIPAGNQMLEQSAAILQAAAASIGLTIDIEVKQPADYAAMFYVPDARAGTDFVVANGYIETPSFLGYAGLFTTNPAQGGIFNWSAYSNPAVDGAMGAANTATSPADAAAAYVDAQAAFAPDQLQVTFASLYQTSFLKDGLTGIVTSIAAYASPWALALGGE
jgi:peptide/nickel transport system substrate-binding protein